MDSEVRARVDTLPKVIMLNPSAATGQQSPFLLNIRITSIGCERCAPMAPAQIFWIKTSRYGIWDNSFLINTPGSSHVISFTPVHRLEFLNYQRSNRAGWALSAGPELWPGASESMYPSLPEKKKCREIVPSKGYLCWGGLEMGYKEWILWGQWHWSLNSDSEAQSFTSRVGHIIWLLWAVLFFVKWAE